MTRPQVVRADTLDLQDQASPTAQEHRKPVLSSPLGVGPPAPHQAAELRHVQEERHQEEENLSHAWHDAQGLSEEPPSDDEAVLTQSTANGVNGAQHEEQTPQQNGNHVGADGDTEMHDAESDDNLEDDMMDKISSSPSISDGNFPSLAQTSPQDESSMMSPEASTATLSRQTEDSPQSEAANQSSSPSSGHSTCSLQRRLAIGKRPGTPVVSRYKDRIFVDDGRPNSWYQGDDAGSSSPFISSPEHYPLGLQDPESPFADHHRTGEYAGLDITIDGPDDDSDDSQVTAIHGPQDDSDSPTLPRVDKGKQKMTEDTLAPPQKLIKSESDIAIEAHLLPLDDPLLDELDPQKPPPPRSLFSAIKAAQQGSGEDEEWETESEDSFYQGSNCADGSFLDQYNDDDSDDTLIDTHFADDGFGGECLRETEDIDFEFVYALHTFVATVEGQANATKGDTMVLLDDSNSYWWLVRVVKDSTIGYLPAEHIETPTERLARLNKHRNIDLSATMLGDTTEKSKNYVKNALRRRNAKKVQFGGQSYVEASEHEYSSDEEEGVDKVYTNGEGSSPDDSSSTRSSTSSSSSGEDKSEDKTKTRKRTGRANKGIAPTAEETNGIATSQESQDQDEIAVAPLNVRGAKDRRSPSPEKKDAPESSVEDELRRQGVDQSRPSEDSFDRQGRKKLRIKSSIEYLRLKLAPGPSRSRLGTIRNTDSFFKDEATETRKITLTPGLLRDDGAVVRSIDGKERGGSFEILDAGKTSLEKNRDDKKKKEKKSGMLSGLFKKKDKKMPKDVKEPGSPQKLSEELSRESPTTESEEPSPTNTQTNLAPQRKPSNGKLHKSPPGSNGVSPSSPTSANNGLRPLVLPSEQAQRESQATTVVGSSATTPRSGSPQQTPSNAERPSLRVRTAEASTDVMNDISNRMRSPSDLKREKVKKATTRQALDVESSPDEEKSADPFADPEEEGQASKAQTEEAAERLSESPVQITSADAAPDNEPPALVGDLTTDSSADELTSLRSSPSPQQQAATATSNEPVSMLSPPGPTNDSHSPPSPVSPPQQRGPGPSSPLPPPPSRSLPPHPSRKNTNSPPPLAAPSAPRNNSTASTSSTNGPATLSRSPSNGAPSAAQWNDAALKAYLDSAASMQDTKDLLQVVYDTSGVVPVSADHPLLEGLFVEERKAVREMGRELDGLLMGWLGRKRVRGGMGEDVVGGGRGGNGGK